jgi:hypothetical protein
MHLHAAPRCVMVLRRVGDVMVPQQLDEVHIIVIIAGSMVFWFINYCCDSCFHP